MVSGFYIGKEGDSIERAEKSRGSISLLAKGGNSEVCIQDVGANETVVIEPGSPEAMEFFYILEGTLHYTDTDGSLITLGPNDYFYVHKLKEHIMFESETYVKVLYYSTEPVFHYLSTTVNELVALAKKVEEKDDYTRGHIDRVCDYAISIGKALGVSAEQIELLGYAGILHDLGKINVPEEILNKRGKLTASEFEIIRKHPEYGAKLVENTYYEALASIIHQHHEQIDGSGYPDGLKGEEILLEARIIAVADAYDAMTTDRPYRKGMSKEEAIEEMKRFRGRHFDGKIIDTFIEMLSTEKE